MWELCDSLSCGPIFGALATVWVRRIGAAKHLLNQTALEGVDDRQPGCLLTIDSSRFLGLAFATADLLLEIDERGQITFAAGAGGRIAGHSDDELVGRSWHDLFAPGDRPLADALIAGLTDGERRGPLDIQLAAEVDGVARLGGLSAFKMPHIAPRISCALTLAQRSAAGRRADGRLLNRAGFEGVASDLIEAARIDGLLLELSLVELDGLDNHRKGLSPQEAQAVDNRVAGALRAEAYGDAAADLGDQRFAVLRKSGDTPDAVARRLSRVLGASVRPAAHNVAVDTIGAPTRMMRALRYSLDTFLTDGGGGLAETLSQVIGHSIERTVAKAGAFGALVENRSFKLVFQPVMSLTSMTVHHHEVLVRFDGDRSPFAMIRMAEELDIIEHLDLAVAEEAVKRLRADRGRTLCLAVNVSGRTIVSSAFIQAVTTLVKDGALRDRLMFEVTESSAIDDLRLAQRNITALQSLGLKVCLDDFGSGASSFAYLQQLPIDVVKIDGSYVRELANSGRDGAMIRHMVCLCHELGVEVVAEMVETQAIEDVLRRSGVDYAQGWLYGQPSAEPAFPVLKPALSVARKRGVVEQWG